LLEGFRDLEEAVAEALKDKPRVIVCIEGNYGSGKTAIAKAMLRQGFAGRAPEQIVLAPPFDQYPEFFDPGILDFQGEILVIEERDQVFLLEAWKSAGIGTGSRPGNGRGQRI